MPFSSNFYLFVFGNVIENRMTMPPKNKHAFTKQKIAFTYPPILLQLLPHSSSTIKNLSSTVVAINYFFLPVILTIP